MIDYKPTLKQELEKVGLPGFTGEVSCSLDAASVNAALTFTANIALNSEIEVTNPS